MSSDTVNTPTTTPDSRTPGSPGVGWASGSAFTRELWLAYRVVAEIHRHGLDLETSPAVQVWGVVEAEIVRWMQQHGITPKLPAMHRDQRPDAEQLANRIACHFVGNSDVSLDEGRHWCREVLSQNT